MAGRGRRWCLLGWRGALWLPVGSLGTVAVAPTEGRPFDFLQNYIARFGHGSAKLARQAQSKEKTLQKMMASGLTERVVSDKVGQPEAVGDGAVEAEPPGRSAGLALGWLGHEEQAGLSWCSPLFLPCPDPFLLLPLLREDPPTGHHGAERELPVQPEWGEWKRWGAGGGREGIPESSLL